MIPVFITVFLISSCEPETPPMPPVAPPGTVWRHLGPGPYPSVAEVHPCPNPGTNCNVKAPSRIYDLAVQESLANFASYYANNNVAGYFDNDPNWQYVFPSLHLNTEKFNKIKSGEYHTLLEAPNFVIFYNGSYPGAGDFYLAFFFEF